MKKLQNNFTTPEQSKRLLDLGVPVKSADCYYMIICGKIDDQTEIIYNFDAFYDSNDYLEDYIPCWSTGRLIEIICNCHIVTNQLMENWICCDKNTNLIELLIRDIEGYTNVQHMDFSKLEE